MKNDEFIHNLRKMGFIRKPNDMFTQEELNAEINIWFDIFIKENVTVKITACWGIDEETEVLWPYGLWVNKKCVIGHKRALKYIGELLEGK